MMIRLAREASMPAQLNVADVGCGAGAQATLWAEDGHTVHALDINEPLIRLATERAKHADLKIHFDVGSATALPWEDRSMDICLLPELLEHVADWEACLMQAARILRAGGMLYLSTTNVLCPMQQEFNLPFYSWYPAIVKRYCEHAAVTTHPGIANHATYPAVNWFTFYRLRRFLEPLGFRCLDRFDLIDAASKRGWQKALISTMRRSHSLRFIGQIATSGLILVAVKV